MKKVDEAGATTVRSPSTRRVWIEIWKAVTTVPARLRHPPRGGCGLKFHAWPRAHLLSPSPSTRRVWIEMYTPWDARSVLLVTLHAEGVD